ncbi:hypothetical protein CARUB_v10016496mg [Capsella rubella]|uniref:Secreted protein n=1 Tax=Capsella rubella TaxID=81985 RepID=R0I556_9BRAS|nr:hypothetical protein CARUB_v10016496mg [Capsella rubella]
MCMFCGLYLWSLIHTLCNSNSDESILHTSLFGLEGSCIDRINVHAQRSKTKKKVLIYQHDYSYICFFLSSLVHII